MNWHTFGSHKIIIETKGLDCAEFGPILKAEIRNTSFLNVFSSQRGHFPIAT